jgi:hypothetical protein
VRSWKLTPKDPLNLVIAADAAFGSIDPLDDQVWEVTLGSGEPPALAIRTRYGMRVVEARYFPIFMRGNEMVSDPSGFHSLPEVKRSLPNYLEIFCMPFEGVEVGLEYWVPGSKILAGRITILNHDPAAGKLDVDWVGQIIPLGERNSMLPESIDLNTVLAGESGGLLPVCFLSGGCGLGTSVFPGLSLQINPRSSKPQVFTWASATMADKSSSYHTARNNAFRSWEAEISRVESANESRLVEIFTGREDWDAVLHTSQKTGFSLVFPLPGSSQATFLQSRTPQGGFSGPGEGWDSTAGGSSQTTWESLYISKLLLPGDADQVRGFLANLLERQHQDGHLDWSVGVKSKSGRMNAQPVLAQLALEMLPYLTEPDWLRGVLPKLESFFLSWFNPLADRDEDGFPEWRASGQSGWAEEKLPWIDNLESPGLAAMLLKEAEAIRVLCESLGEPFPGEVNEKAQELTSALLECWDEDSGIFRYRDFETHHTSMGEILLETAKEGSFPLKGRFSTPQRLVVKVEICGGLRKPFHISLRGRARGKPCTVELKSRDFSWMGFSSAVVTGEVFSQVDKVTLRGLSDGDSLRVETCDSSGIDFNLVLPAAAGATIKEMFKTLVRDTIPAKFLFEKGLRVTPGSPKAAPVQFNTYLIEGLLAKGERDLAAALFGGMLNDLVERLRDRMLPASNSLESTVPVSTFLKLCGVEAITSREVILKGFNSFPGIVRIRYRDVNLMLHADKSVILLNQNEQIEITSPERICVPLGHTGGRS